MSLSRRAFLCASAAAALTAACSPGTDAAPTNRTATPSVATTSAPSPSATDPQTARRTVEVRHGSRTSPLVALTFHGNGDVSLARRLLGVLEKAGVHGTVLAVGTWLKAEPAMAGRILDAGHDLGNHTLHHYPMRSLAARVAYNEIDGCARVLHSTSGSRSAWFRASGTQLTTPTIRRAAGRAGYDRCISYDVDGLDWQDPSATPS
jgi:peptidoglycan/xylan/chitin deacetylase (PgdA/CDA1 family)